MTDATKKRERMCIGCQTLHPKGDLVRIVRSPEGEFSLDLTGKKAGRVYRSLSLVPCSADDIAARTGLTARDVIMELTDLEVDGLITCLGKNQYVLKV